MPRPIFIAAQKGEERKNIVTAFKNHGYEVITAETAQEADEYLKSAKRLEAILITSDFDNKDHNDIRKLLEENRKHSKTPTFIMEDKDIDKVKFKAVGFYDFIQRPLSSTKIVQKIRAFKADEALNTLRSYDPRKQMLLAGIVLAVGATILMYFVFFPLMMGK